MENQQSNDSIPALTTEPESIMIPMDDEIESMFLSNIHHTSIGRFEVDNYKGLKEQVIEFYTRHNINCTEFEDVIHVESKLTVRGHVISTKTRQESKDNKNSPNLHYKVLNDLNGSIHLVKFSRIQIGNQRILVFISLELTTVSTIHQYSSGKSFAITILHHQCNHYYMVTKIIRFTLPCLNRNIRIAAQKYS